MESLQVVLSVDGCGFGDDLRANEATDAVGYLKSVRAPGKVSRIDFLAAQVLQVPESHAYELAGELLRLKKQPKWFARRTNAVRQDFQRHSLPNAQ